MISRLLWAVGLCLALTGCGLVRQDEVCSRVSLPVREREIQSLPSPFKPLTPEELAQPFGVELHVAKAFARELDLYRAITAFKRALYLLPSERQDRRLEAEYGLFLSYYLGGKHAEALYSFENSHLSHVPTTFAPYDDLLIALEDTYRWRCEEDRAQNVHALLRQRQNDQADELRLGHAMADHQLPSLMDVSPDPLRPEVGAFLHCYCACTKSPGTAMALQAVLPGAGYFYVGQHRAALTSLVINTVFIAATYQFFHQGNWGAGLIAGSLEFGWYVGGINGAGLAAKAYNERLYQVQACEFMREHRLFPLLQMRHSF